MCVRPNTELGTDPYTPTYSPPSPGKEEDPTFKAYGGDLQKYLRHYHAAVSQVDAGVGRLVAELAHLGIAENTIIVFSSDHGDMQGSHGLTNKCVPYEESVRIPFVAAGPGIAKGYVRKEAIGTVDFFPTFAELCGGGSPTGFSLAPALWGGDAILPTRIFSEDQSGWAIVREDRWKLVCGLDGDVPAALFDLDVDPFEEFNLLGSGRTADIERRLLDRIRIWRDQHPLRAAESDAKR